MSLGNFSTGISKHNNAKSGGRSTMKIAAEATAKREKRNKKRKTCATSGYCSMGRGTGRGRERNGGQSVNLERFVNVTAAERRPRIEGRRRRLIHFTHPLYLPPLLCCLLSAHPRISLLCLKCLPRLMNNARNFSSAFGFLLSVRFAFFSFFYTFSFWFCTAQQFHYLHGRHSAGGSRKGGCSEEVRRHTSFSTRSMKKPRWQQQRHTQSSRGQSEKERGVGGRSC